MFFLEKCRLATFDDQERRLKTINDYSREARAGVFWRPQPQLIHQMNTKQIAIYAAVFLAGVILANKVRQLPLVNKLPQI